MNGIHTQNCCVTFANPRRVETPWTKEDADEDGLVD
jgi:hypothetical protein